MAGMSRRTVASAVAAALTVSTFGAIWVGPAAAPAAAVPPGFQDEILWTGLTAPTEIAFGRDGSVFVAEKSGIIHRFDGLEDTTRTQVADLRTVTHNANDRGLLGLAVDPEFGPDRPYLYVQYTYDHVLGSPAPPPRWGTPGATFDACPTPPGPTADGCVVSGRLSKLTLAGPRGGVLSEQVLVEDWCAQYPSHSIGTIVFGDDGMLYAGGGDGASFNFVDYGQGGGSAGSPTPVNPCGDRVPPGTTPDRATSVGGALRAQAPPTGVTSTLTGDVSLSGAVIRVDPDTGEGVPGNPWFGRPGATPNEERIIAYGLRNPFRFSARGGTNELWLGDVGWNTTEEINVVPDVSAMDEPVNFGWPCYEGNSRQGGYDAADLGICEELYARGPSAVTGPTLSYRHNAPVTAGETCSSGASSIAGVAYYNRPTTPGITPYPERYDGAVFFTDYNRRCIWVALPGADGRPDPDRIEFFHAASGGIVNLVVGPDGDLYYPNIDRGRIQRIRYFPDNVPPVASFSVTAVPDADPPALRLDAAGSSDSDGDVLSYAWDLDGDGAYDDATGEVVTRPAPAATVTVGLRVTDARGASSETTRDLQPIGSAPSPQISAPTATTTWEVGQRVDFAGSATDAQDGALPASALRWEVRLLTCDDAGEDCVTRTLERFDGATGTAVAPDWSGKGNTLWEFRLIATDSGGLSAATAVRLAPRTVDLTFRTVPEGLSLAVGSDAAAPTPFTRTAIVGSQNSISAPSPQFTDGQWWGFDSWSDGGSATHTITAPASATTYTATYVGTDEGGTPPTVFVPVEPTRVMAGTAIGPGGTADLDLADVLGAGVPAGVRAVSVNVTVAGITEQTFVSLCPGDTPADDCALTSTLNPYPGRDVANLAIAILDGPPGGDATRLRVRNDRGSVLVYLDVVGFHVVDEGAGTEYVPVGPIRLADAPVLGAAGRTTVRVGDVPDGATAVAVRATASAVSAGTFVSVCPTSDDLEECRSSSTLNPAAGRDTSNMTVVPLPASGPATFDVYNNVGSVLMQFDVLGYQVPTGGGLRLVAVPPQRILDKEALGVAGSRTFPLPSVPTEASALALNLTTSANTAVTYLSSCPPDLGLEQCRETSTVNSYPGQDTATSTIVGTGDGEPALLLYNNLGTTQVDADLTGFYVRP